MAQYSLDFVFDFNDLGMLKAEVIVSALELSRGRISIEVTDVILENKKVAVDKDFLLEICNDQYRAIYADIECQVIDRWHVA